MSLLHPKIIIVSIAAVVVLGYAYIKTKDILEGPNITVTEPENGATVSESLAKVRGTAKHITSITLNDRPITVAQDGTIDESVLLSYGYNVLELSAEDRLGRSVTKTIEVVYK